MENSSEKRHSRNGISIIVYSGYALTGECATQILKSKRGFDVKAVEATEDGLLRSAKSHKPDVIVFFLENSRQDLIDIMPEIFEVSPNSKTLIVVPLEDGFDQTKALRLGASGIVGANKREEVLMRAIRQVASGELWVNQKLIAKLLNPETPKNGASGKVASNELTSRELDVIQAIALGLNNKEIAKHLLISEATVRHHLSSIYSKLYVDDRLNLVIYAYTHGIVSPPIENA